MKNNNDDSSNINWNTDEELEVSGPSLSNHSTGKQKQHPKENKIDVINIEWNTDEELGASGHSQSIISTGRSPLMQPEVLERESKKQVVVELNDIRQNPQNRSRDELLKVIDMAYELLTYGSCDSCCNTEQDISKPEYISDEEDDDEIEHQLQRGPSRQSK